MSMVADRLARLSQKVRPWVPFTALNTVGRSLGKSTRSILDVGCGDGEPMKFINRRRRFYAVGADIFEPYLQDCRRQENHGDLVRCDVRHLPFQAKSFDVVLCMELLEHLDEAAGRNLIGRLEEIARRRVIISTPAGKHEQHEYDDNPHQEHKHIWHPAEMKRLGYEVRGHGLRNLGGMSGRQSPLPRLLRPLVDVAWVLAGPLVYFRPAWGGNMVCTKTLGTIEQRSSRA